mmetsp:Transcript_101958/g.287786  ORF Transcript_101958/g.287786 Transcript_101958/m.287786 type:complete len:321 (+) Transcript_101958:49-1011(+)
MRSTPQWMLRCAAVVAVLVTSASGKPDSKGGSKACSHTGFYSKKVVPLCEKHFPDDASKNPWVVQFYHPYVKENFESKAAFEGLAATTDQIQGAKVGAVDCMNNGEFCAKHGIRKAPTTRVTLHGNTREFEGDHTLEALQAFVRDSMKKFEAAEEALKCNIKGVFTDNKKDAAVPLCLSSFPPSTESFPWLISFYESGDRNKDKTMRSVMNKLAEKFGNNPPKKVDAKKKALKVRVGAVECTDQGGCGDLGITSFPAARFYSSWAEPADFDSFFDREELQKWTDAKLKDMPKLEKTEVLKADMPEGRSATAGTAEGQGEL